MTRILNSMFWPELSRDVTAWCRSCDVCQKQSSLKKSDKAPLHPLPLIGEPMSDIECGVMGRDLPRSQSGKRYVLLICCINSRWINAIPIPNQKAKTLANAIMVYCNQFGIPRTCRFVAGSSFKSSLMEAFARVLKIDVKFASPYHETTQELVERSNKII